MNRLLASIAVVLLMFAVARGQDNSPKQVEIETRFLGLTVKAGLDVGINFSNAMFDPDDFAQNHLTKSGRTGLLIGLPLELGINEDAFVRFEPTFVQAGYRIEGTNYNDKLNVNYLQFPVLFQYKFRIPGFAGRPYAAAGPVIGFLLSARETESYSYIGYAGTSDESDVSEHYSGSNVGIQFGGGMDYPVCPQWTAFADCRYELGLSNVYNPVHNPLGLTVTTPLGPTVITPDPKVRYGGLSIRIGGMYNF